MPIATLSDAPSFNLGALAVHSLAVPSRGSKELATWRVDLPSGGRSGEHSVSREQVIIVIAGSVSLHVDGTTVTAGEGDALILPTDSVLELSNDGSESASAVVLSVVGFNATAGGHTFTPPWAL